MLSVRAASVSEGPVLPERTRLDPPADVTVVDLELLALAGRAGVDVIRTVGTGWERAVILPGALLGGAGGSGDRPNRGAEISTPIGSVVTLGRSRFARTAAGFLDPVQLRTVAAQ